MSKINQLYLCTREYISEEEEVFIKMIKHEEDRILEGLAKLLNCCLGQENITNALCKCYISPSQRYS